MWMGQPQSRNHNLEPCLVGDRGAQPWKAAPVEVLLLLVAGPPGRGSVIMADIQHNVWVILLSR